MLKPQDILVALKLVALGTERWTYASLAKSLGLSVSETHAAVKRGLESRLLTKLNPNAERAERPLPNLAHLERLIVHGLPYLMPVPRGPKKICMGMPTADGVSPLDDEFYRPTDYLPPVWPLRGGKVKGWGLPPIHRSCPLASKQDAHLYVLLTLVDGLRAGKARVRQAAQRILLEKFAEFSRQLRS
jgi:hypothetical protein